MKRATGLILCVAFAAAPHVAFAQRGEEVWADGRDPWTLLLPGMMNRQLAEQIEHQRWRWGRQLDPFAFAINLSVGSEQAFEGAQSRFHGYFVLDAYLAVEMFEGLDINLNFTVFNPSASDGYRRSSQILHGLALHLSRPIMMIDGVPVIFDLMSSDLDKVTLGKGLLLDQQASEGILGAFRYGPTEGRLTFVGRSIWVDDNIIATELTFWRRALGLQATWWFGDSPFSQTQPGFPFDGFSAILLGAFGEVNPIDELRFAAEYIVRADNGTFAQAALARTDFIYATHDDIPARVHLGYQARFYQHGFGPRTKLVTPSQTGNVPIREQVYVTNPFEMLPLTPQYDQWSHTLMAEAELELFPRVQAFGTFEYWIRVVIDPAPVDRPVTLYQYGKVPGVLQNGFYRAGLRYLPWERVPHRIGVFVTNKAVSSRFFSFDVSFPRFAYDPFIFFEAEVFL